MLNQSEIQLILQLKYCVIHYWETDISDSLCPMLASTKEDFDNFSRFSSDYAFHSSMFDELTTNSSFFGKDSTYSEVNSLDIELSTSDPPAFKFSSASFFIDFDKEVFEDHLRAVTSHLKDYFIPSSQSSETFATSFS